MEKVKKTNLKPRIRPGVLKIRWIALCDANRAKAEPRKALEQKNEK